MILLICSLKSFMCFLYPDVVGLAITCLVEVLSTSKIEISSLMIDPANAVFNPYPLALSTNFLQSSLVK